MIRAWCCISLADRPAYQGNDGHRDRPGASYAYDSKVANHLQVSAGDIIALRDRQKLIGFSVIDSIESEPDTRTMSRCPDCHSTAIKKASTLTPPWRCRNGHVFHAPLRHVVPVTAYHAAHASQYTLPPRWISTVRLNSCILRPASQLSIQEMSLPGFVAMIGMKTLTDPLLEHAAAVKQQQAPAPRQGMAPQVRRWLRTL